MSKITSVYWVRQGGKCFYCRVDMVATHDQANPRRFTKDHKHPAKERAAGKPKDIVGACNACNLAKGGLEFDVFVAILAKFPGDSYNGRRAAIKEQSRRDRLNGINAQRDGAVVARESHNLQVDGSTPSRAPSPQE